VFSSESFTKPPDFLWARFWLSQGAFALPPYWSTDAPPDDLSLYQGTRLDVIAFPSSKGLLLDIHSGLFEVDDSPAAARDTIFVALGDGSAGPRPVTDELNDNWVFRPSSSAPLPTLATRHGFLGRDF